MEQNKTWEYTLKQRILTLFAIAIGIAFAWGVCGEYMWSGEPDMSSAMLIYGGFWLVYMAGFYFAAWDRAKRSVWGYVLLAVAAVLVLRPLMYKQVELTFINFAALPAVLMLHAVTVCFTAQRTAGWAYNGVFQGLVRCAVRVHRPLLWRDRQRIRPRQGKQKRHRRARWAYNGHTTCRAVRCAAYKCGCGDAA